MFTSRNLIALVFAFIATMLINRCIADGDSGSETKSEGASAAEPTKDPKLSSAEAAKSLDDNDSGKAPVADTTTADNEVAASDPANVSGSANGSGLPVLEGRLEPTEEVLAALQAGPRALSLAFRMAAKRATPSVVVLYAYGQDINTGEEDGEEKSEDNLPLLERAEIPKPPPAKDRLTGLGSGVIVSEDGLIITNNHVIRNAKKVVVQLPDETRVDAEFFRGDPDSDVGMLRVNSTESLQAIEFGDSDKLEIGDWVLAIGSPFRLEATVSAGIISGKNRQLERIRRSNMLQTDAAINPGNSGGALIDLDGKVIGISTAIATRNGGYQGVGFAIPINQARWIADELDQHGKVRRAAIGTTLAELKPRIARQFKLEPYSGVLVYQVVKGSVAEIAGIKPLDVIVEFAGERTRDSQSLQAAIERKPIGSEQPIVVQRGGKRVELVVELATVDDTTGKGK